MVSNGNAQTVCSVNFQPSLHFCSLMSIVIEKVFDVRFASQRENDYLLRCSDMNKGMIE
jgi:hypothetical protein